MSRLLELALELVKIESVSRNEASIASHVEARLRATSGLAVERVGDNVVARSDLGRRHRVLLAGHLDTVPPFDESAPRIEGEILTGLGAVDMKGGLAVMLDLATAVEDMSVDVTFIFYACEEIKREASGLGVIERDRPELLRGDAAILAEPTGCAVEAGCQGTMRAEVTVVGRRAHTARPMAGVNAIHRLAPVLGCLAGYEPREAVLDGCVYAEQLQAVGVSGGVAGNVVPDRATLTLNYRFAPDRDLSGAEAELRRLVGDGLDATRGDSFAVIDAAEGAPPRLDNPLIRELVDASDSAPRAKVGWTDVATFYSLGVPAANFGPGDPFLAHTPDEQLSDAELHCARDRLRHFLRAAGAS